MTSLRSGPLAATLNRLLNLATSSTSPSWDSLDQAETLRMLNSKTEYRKLYTEVLKEFWLPVSRDTGQLLYLLARSTQAKNIIEFGTSFGISTLFLASALKDNGHGKIITSEFEQEKVIQARKHFLEAEVADLIEVREGDALETLAKDLPDVVDMLILDGAKVLYNDVLALVEPKLTPGALIVADNADMNPAYVQHVRAKENGYLSLPFGEDVELTIKIH